MKQLLIKDCNDLLMISLILFQKSSDIYNHFMDYNAPLRMKGHEQPPIKQLLAEIPSQHQDITNLSLAIFINFLCFS
jgi:hypothetical protein